jgi:hypothetical protein
MNKTKSEEDLTFYFEERKRRELAFKTFLRNFFSFLHKYLSSLVVIPATLGGIWQILELISIKVALIRFFSVSQIIADGLIVLIFSIILIFIAFFFISIYIIDPPTEPYKEIKDKDEVCVALSDFFTIMCGYVALWFLIRYTGRDIEDHSTGRNLWMLFISMLGFVTISFLIFVRYANLKFEHPKGGYMHYMMGYIVIGLWLFFLGKVFSMFHVIFLVPKELVNTKQIVCKVEKQFPDKKFKLQYFNDKYVFVEIEEIVKGQEMRDSVTTKVFILNFDELLKEDNCVEKPISNSQIKIKY